MTEAPYTFPHTTHGAQIEYICDRRGHAHYPIVFIVKCYHANLDFDHLYEIFKDSGYLTNHAPEYRAFCREQHAEHHESLWEWGLEDARRGITDDDAHRMVWDSDGPTVTVEFGFAGRSGGWLVVTNYAGANLRGVEIEAFCAELDAAQIEHLYKLIRQWEVDFATDKLTHELEYQAAFNLFCNICEPGWENEHEHTQLLAACAVLERELIGSAEGGAALARLKAYIMRGASK